VTDALPTQQPREGPLAYGFWPLDMLDRDRNLSVATPAGTFPVSSTSDKCNNPAHGGAVNEGKIKNAFNVLSAICLAATVSNPDPRPKWNLHTVLD
jgi:hypothetical protein